MSQRPGRIVPSLALPLLTLLAVSACGTLQPTHDQTLLSTSPDHTASEEDWEKDARLLSDHLMEEARNLATEGRTEEALARLDDALCAVLETPEGYQPHPAYLDYVALLVVEAQALEPTMSIVSLEEQPEEFVDLPQIEVAETPTGSAVAGTADEPLLPDSDYPLVYNPTVESFLNALVEPGEYRSRVENGLLRAGTYLPMIRTRMNVAGLPEDLAYLPLIESAFSVRAYSRARAHGMWQFIASTGRHYGLEVGTLIDERRDPERSTEAAIAYLTDLYGQFNDWHLALAAYNSGAGNVRRAIRRAGSTDFWTIRRYLPRETRNYVPAFIASVVVAKQPLKYGFPAPDEREWAFDEITVPDALDLEFLSARIDLKLETLREINPAIRRDLTPANRATRVRLPSGYGSSAAAVLDNVPSSEWAPRLVHTVRSGESLYSIAQRYGSSVSAIRQANQIPGSLIRPGQTLVVPRLGIAYAEPTVRVAEGGSYVVQRSDTLWDIARSFGVTVDGLCAANGLSRWDVIHPGQRLSIPVTPATAPLPASSSETVYRVRKGDTLYDIARRFGTSVDEIKRANGLNGSRIFPGDLLRIPSVRIAG